MCAEKGVRFFQRKTANRGGFSNSSKRDKWKSFERSGDTRNSLLCSSAVAFRAQSGIMSRTFPTQDL